MAYELIKRGKGVNTQGTTSETLDGIRLDRLKRISEALKRGEYKFDPARRVIIPKPGKRTIRPLDISSQKVVQKAMEIALSILWETTWRNHSHGFLHGKSTRSALEMVKTTIRYAKFVIEGDIKNCFGEMDHKILLDLLAQKIKCKKTLELFRSLLTMGFVDSNGKYHPTRVGIPQGSIPGPVMANIYLNEFDKYMEELIARLGLRKPLANPKFWKHYHHAKHLEDKGITQEAAQYFRLHRHVPKYLPNKKAYVRYVRYADDFIIGVEGSLEKTLILKTIIQLFLLNRLKLKLREEKTKVTPGYEGFLFLGFRVIIGLKKQDFYRKRLITIPLEPIVKVLVSVASLARHLYEDGLVKKRTKNESYIPCR